MSPNHENVNTDMLIDRAINRLMTGMTGMTGKNNMNSTDLPDIASIVEILDLIVPCDGSLGCSTEEYAISRVAKYKKNIEALEELVKIPIIEQKSAEWHRVRQTIVTASDFAQALGEGKFGTQLEFLQKKSGYKEFPFDANCPPLKWGCMFEDVACAIYEKRNSIKVLPFGLIKHPSVEHFGASPDGITTLGIMVEIKCPFKRKITNEVPQQYFYQIQGQLDVCGLDECDYLECEFKRVSSLNELRGMHDAREIGCIYEYDDQKYKYSPIFSSDDQGHDALCEWVSENSKDHPSGTNVQQHLWYLDVINIIRVYKDDDFLKRKMAELKDVWDRVIAYRGSRELYDSEIGDNSIHNKIKVSKPSNPSKPSKSSTVTTAGTFKSKTFVEISGYGFMDD